jgi:glutathione S-transferase
MSRPHSRKIAGEPAITLYRDHAAWCPYCHKIVLQLEEKRIPYRVEKVNMRCYGDKPPAFMAKVPSGLLPVLEIGGRCVTESAVIQQLLEALPGYAPLLPPAGAPERARAEALMRLERRLFSEWMRWLTSGWQHEAGKAAFCAALDAAEAALGEAPGPYFLAEFSLVDCTFAPFLERIAASIFYYKGLAVRGGGRWLALEAWFAAMEARPAYAAFRSDYYTHVHDLPPQLGGCTSHADAAAGAAAVDGAGPAWRLPLPPLSAAAAPEPFAPGDAPEADRLRAAARLVGNHAAVVRFACRGPGRPGLRPVAAPLADPTAEPDEAAAPAVDAALRHVAHALLAGAEAKQADAAHALAAAGAAGAGAAGAWAPGAPVLPALEYLRDRVGVPRDLPYPAARQLRAHLNWARDLLAEAAV